MPENTPLKDTVVGCSHFTLLNSHNKPLYLSEREERSEKCPHKKQEALKVEGYCAEGGAPQVHNKHDPDIRGAESSAIFPRTGGF